MYLEVTKNQLEVLRKKLDEKHIPYQILDCTLKGEKQQIFRLDFGANDPTLAKEIYKSYLGVMDILGEEVTRNPYIEKVIRKEMEEEKKEQKQKNEKNSIAIQTQIENKPLDIDY